MIILNLRIDNLYNFSKFEMDFSYPKKIANSTIGEEHLLEYKNFRYKKAVILMGTNAIGKTCLGRVIKNTCDFLNEGNPSYLLSMVNDKTQSAEVVLEMVNDGKTLIEVCAHVLNGEIKLIISRALIGEKDSYETVHGKLVPCYQGPYRQEVIDIIGRLNYKFAYPEIENSLKTNVIDEKVFLNTLRCVIGTLDPTLKDISIAKDLRNSYIIRRGESEIIIQDGKLLNRELLSSGTVEGIDIALFLAMMASNKNAFYYCDEHFSYIQSDIEKKIFSIMLGKLKDNDQLIFTTHNIDMLELNLPKHTFALMRRNEDQKTEVVYVSSLLKRNTDSVRCAVENDAFLTMPDLSLLDDLEERNEE